MVSKRTKPILDSSKEWGDRRPESSRSRRPAVVVVPAIAMVVVMALVSCSDNGAPSKTASPVATGSSEAPQEPQTQTLSIVDVTSGEETVFTAPAGASGFAFTLDGAMVAFTNTDDNGNDQIFVMGADGSNLRQITSGDRSARHPTWAPDGSAIAYEGDTPNDPQIFHVPAAGGASTMLTDEPLGAVDPGGWTPDGSSIVYSSDHGSQFTAWSVDVTTGKTRRIVPHGSTPRLSPDGAWLAFNSWVNEPVVRLLVMDTDGGTQRLIARLDGDDGYERWSPDSTRLAYIGSTEEDGSGTYVYDFETGETRFVTAGRVESWIDNDQILVS